MSTTTCVAPQIGVEQRQPFRRVGGVSNPGWKSRVSQKIDAVSASAIGVERWIGVRSARFTLWYACPSSCASVDTES